MEFMELVSGAAALREGVTVAAAALAEAYQEHASLQARLREVQEQQVGGGEGRGGSSGCRRCSNCLLLLSCALRWGCECESCYVLSALLRDYSCEHLVMQGVDVSLLHLSPLLHSSTYSVPYLVLSPCPFAPASCVCLTPSPAPLPLPHVCASHPHLPLCPRLKCMPHTLACLFSPASCVCLTPSPAPLPPPHVCACLFPPSLLVPLLPPRHAAGSPCLPLSPAQVRAPRPPPCCSSSMQACVPRRAAVSAASRACPVSGCRPCRRPWMRPRTSSSRPMPSAGAWPRCRSCRAG